VGIEALADRARNFIVACQTRWAVGDEVDEIYDFVMVESCTRKAVEDWLSARK
jgi:hypothetical protein